MAAITEEEVTKLRGECTDYRSMARTYTRLLGFRQLSQSKCENGPQKYSGIVQEFCEATKEVVNTCSLLYNSRKEVQEAVHDHELTFRIVDRCLEQYGPRIWNSGEDGPYITLCDDSYPRHLIFEDAGDRNRIRIYVFCWIVQRLCRKVEDEKRDSRRRPHNANDDIYHPDQTHVDTSFTSSNSTAAILPQESPNMSSSFRAPEAAMVHNVIATTVPPDVEARASLMLLSNAARQNPPYATRGQRSDLSNIMRDRVSDNDGDSPDTQNCIQFDDSGYHSQNRKRRLSVPADDESTSFLSLQRSGKLKTVRGLKRKGSSSGQSLLSPLNTRLNGERIICDPRDTPVSSNGFQNVDADSVQGETTEPESAEDTTVARTAQGTNPSLIVKLKLSYLKASEVRRDRRRLALALLKGLRIDAQPQQSLPGTLDLIRSLWASDSLRLRDNFGDAYDPYGQVLEQWLGCVGILLEFQNATGFLGDQKAWELHLSSLHNDRRMNARRHLLEAGIAMMDWVSKHKDFMISSFSTDVFHVLFIMAEWMSCMNGEDKQILRDQISTLIESLLGWFN